MMSKRKDALYGKKLLILAGSVNEIEIVNRAGELGVYTIVTDYYDESKSPAKKIADESWNISWTDYDTLEKKCIENQVDGIIGGYSEFVVESVIKLCERLSLPCYSTEEQLETIRDKNKFKNFCIAHNIPVAKGWDSIEEVTEFPVIVKPTDRGGSIGVSAANNYEELVKSYSFAMEKSIKKSVIIEQYISQGNKFDVYYAVIDGEISFVASSDTIMSQTANRESINQCAWLYPSRNQETFIKKLDAGLREFISALKIQNGYITFSGIFDGKAFYFFEAGFRLTGEHIYKYVEMLNGNNLMDIFLYYALTGSAKNLDFKNLFDPDIKGVAINLFAKEDCHFDYEQGFEKIKSMDDLRHFVDYSSKDFKRLDTAKKVALFQFFNKNANVLKTDAETVFNYFKDSYVEQFDTSVIDSWWDK